MESLRAGFFVRASGRGSGYLGDGGLLSLGGEALCHGVVEEGSLIRLDGDIQRL